MFFKKKIFPLLILFTALVGTAYGLAGSSQHYDLEAARDYQQPISAVDTVTRYPVNNQRKETYDDLNRQYPMDLGNPGDVKSVVEYVVKFGNYVLTTRVGEMEISTPYTLTPDEYQKYSLQNDKTKYWREKNSATVKSNEDKFSVTDMKFSLGPADKLFGPGGVLLKTQGSAELIFGFKSNFIDNPALTQRARRSNIPNFDQKIQLNVNGKVGDKINFGLNYNTEASFDFDQKLVKLSYKGKEDDIFQNIEAGNVSMQLNSSLITGSTALFGIKTDMQFGKLKVSAIASQQESQSQTVSSKGGSQTIPFEVPIDQYDDNRHFFLSHFFLNNYESALSKLPFISSGVIINLV